MSDYDAPWPALEREERLAEKLRAERDRLRTEVQIVTDEWVAARDEIRRLRTVNAALLEALEEAREMVEAWSAYASEYFRDKHDLAADLAKLDAAIALAKVKP